MAALKQLSKGSSWKFSRDYLFREHQGWFFYIAGGPWVGQARTRCALHLKPMGLDPLFWEIVDTRCNAEQPLSFRLFGAWTARVPEWISGDIDESGRSPVQIAGAVLEWADVALRQSVSVSKPGAFLTFVQERSNASPEWRFLAAEISMLLLMGDLRSALDKCREARARNITGGYSVGTKSFVDLAIERIEAPPSGAMH